MRFLRWPQVHDLVGLSRPTVWRLEREGQFPQRRRITESKVGWVEAEVVDWLRSREVGMGPIPARKIVAA